MPNLFITQHCGRGCAFCFAQQGPWSAEYPGRNLTLSEVAEFFAMLPHRRRAECGIIGGEPLLHPDLAGIIRLCWTQGLAPKIFTSGTAPLRPELEALETQYPLRFIVNVSPWESYTPERRACLLAFLTRFGAQSSLSYTLADPEFDNHFLLEDVERFHLQRIIRVGIAVPMIGGGNQYIQPAAYREAARALLTLARNAHAQQIRLGMDCGFVPCMFSTEEIGELLWMRTHFGSICTPVIDIGPELETWHCFPLARLLRLSFRRQPELGKIRRHYQHIAEHLRQRFGPGIYAHCPSCSYYARRLCTGGCLGLLIPSVLAGQAALEDLINLPEWEDSACPISC